MLSTAQGVHTNSAMCRECTATYESRCKTIWSQQRVRPTLAQQPSGIDCMLLAYTSGHATPFLTMSAKFDQTSADANQHLVQLTLKL